MTPRKNPRHNQTADATFSKALLAYAGEDITLPDMTVIRAVVHEQRDTRAGEFYENTHAEVLWARIPTDSIGTLAAEQVVTFQEAPHYVATLQPTGKGWTMFTLERQ